MAIEIDASDLEAKAAAFMNDLPKVVRRSVLDAAKAGERAAVAAAPHRTYRLRNQIEGRMVSTSEASAEAELISAAEYSSFVNDGTRPHVIRPRNAAVLAFDRGGSPVFARRVQHPGTAAQPFMKAGEDAADEVLQSAATAGVTQLSKNASS